MKPLEILVDRESCATCDACCEVAPNTFALDSEGKASVRAPHGDPHETIIKAASSCPMGAITVRDGESGATLVPNG